MKKFGLLILSILLLPALCLAEDFYGAPLLPNGKVVEKSKSRLEIRTQASHDEVLAYYKEALKDQQDVKYRDWSDSTYVEDDGNRAWHSITISKEPDEVKGTSVVIMKDNWTWIIGTLFLRFIGVFVVLLILYLGMSLSGGIISRVVKGAEAKKVLAKAP